MISEKGSSPEPEKKDGVAGTDRREFILGAATAAALGIGGAVSAAYGQSESNAHIHPSALKKPISWRLLKHEKSTNAPFTESHSVIELTGADGMRQIVDSHTRRLDYQAGHEDLVMAATDEYAASNGSDVPTRSFKKTVVASTIYGEIKDGKRPDVVKVQIFDEAGFHSSAPATIKVPVPNPYAGLSFEELMNRIFSEKLGAHR
jgi:hypothetical protein